MVGCNYQLSIFKIISSYLIYLFTYDKLKKVGEQETHYIHYFHSSQSELTRMERYFTPYYALHVGKVKLASGG